MSVFVRLRTGWKISCFNIKGGVMGAINRNMSVSSIGFQFPKTSLRPSYSHSPDAQALVGLTMGQVIDQSIDQFGDLIAVIDRPQQIRKTFSELHSDIEKLAAGFLALKLRKGDRIAIWSPNRYEWIVTQMASYKAGLLVVPLNSAYQPPEFEYCLKKLRIRAVVAADSFKVQEYYKFITKVVPEISDSKPGQIKSKTHPYFDTLILFSDQDIQGAFKFKDVLNAGGSNDMAELRKIEKQIQFDDPLTTYFTSGTTGKAKASVHSHFSIVNDCLSLHKRIGSNSPSEQHRGCCSVPFFHFFGGAGVACMMMFNGARVILPSPDFNAGVALKTIEEERCTRVYGTPTMFYDMINHPNFSKTDLSSASGAMLGGSACKKELFWNIIKSFGFLEAYHGYGCTEIAVISAHHLNDELTYTQETSGKLLPNIEMKIVDENGSIVPIGTPGEICVRGYCLHKGYWEDEKSSKDAMIDNWFCSGDIGILREDDRIKIIGRKKEMISRGGTKIFPAEIEEFIQGHPKIAEVNVFGVSDERLGEEVCAWVKLQDNQSLSETEVKEYCKGQLAHFKIPRYVHFVKDFPRTAIGKPQKFAMREAMDNILKSTKTN